MTGSSRNPPVLVTSSIEKTSVADVRWTGRVQRRLECQAGKLTGRRVIQSQGWLTYAAASRSAAGSKSSHKGT